MRQHTLAKLACLALGAIASLCAQDLTITNARIIGANGAVIERGSIVVRAGKIASVAPGAPSAASGTTHRRQGHDRHARASSTRTSTSIPDPTRRLQMQALLEAGYTTILSGGGPAEGNITLRDHIEKGLINGPRIIPSGSLEAEQQHSGNGSRRDTEDGRDGHQVYGRDRPDSRAGADAKKKWKFSRPSWTKRRKLALWCRSTR